MNQAPVQPMSMTCEQFANSLWNDMFFDPIIDDMYWSRDYRSETLLNAMKAEAQERGVLLEDLGNWDYDEFFYEIYCSTEKGLS